MSLKIKNKVLITKYKALFEEKQLVIHELNEGLADLAYYLNYFKKKLNTNIKNQEKSYSNLFFNSCDNQQNKKKLPAKQSHIAKKDNKEKKPAWVKKLYKKIVMCTHPDKLSGIESKIIISKFKKYYMLAVESYATNNYQNLLMLSYDLDIEVESQLIDEYVKPYIPIIEKEILSKKILLGYQWYHIEESNKLKSLENYLTNLGFIFTKEEVLEAIKQRREKSKRKVGKRPENHRKIKLK